MKIKNIQLSLAVLMLLTVFSFSFYVSYGQNAPASGNIFLDSDQDGLFDQEEMLYGTDTRNIDSDGDGYSDGAEVKSGYNPLKAAPGDKLATTLDETLETQEEVLGVETDNLTSKVSQQVSEIVKTAQENEESSGITLDQLQEIIDQSFVAPELTEENLPEIKREDLKILNQDYSGLSEEKKKEKMKDDFLNYAVAIAYIISSNAPDPITSDQDINKISATSMETIMKAIDARNVSELDDLEKSGDKILEQLKEVEVPDEMVDTHIKAMQYATYAKELKTALIPHPDDPLKDIANFTKMQVFIESLQEFMIGVQDKFAKYDVGYDKRLEDKLKSYGLNGIITATEATNASSDNIGTGTTAPEN